MCVSAFLISPKCYAEVKSVDFLKTQLTITCSMSSIETLEQDVKYVQS